MTAAILLEDGGDLLTEQGGLFLLEVQPAPPVGLRVQANGRWRTVSDYRWWFADFNTLSPMAGEAGFTLFLDTSTAASAQIDSMKMLFTAPSGDSFEVGSDLFFAGVDLVAGNLIPGGYYVGYTFGPDDLSEIGLWSVEMTLNSVPISGVGSFQVAGTTLGGASFWPPAPSAGSAETYVELGNLTSYTLADGTVKGQRVGIKDNLRQASADNPITINGKIDGGSSITINVAGAALEFVWSVASDTWLVF